MPLSLFADSGGAVVEEAYTQEAPDGFRVASCQFAETPDDVPIRLNHPDLGIKVSLQPTAEIRRGWYHLELCFPPEGVVDLLVNVSLGKDGQFWLRPWAMDRNQFAADLRITERITHLNLLVAGSGELRWPLRFSLVRTGRLVWLISLARRALYVLKRDRLRFVHSAVRALWGLTRPGMLAMSRGYPSNPGERSYDTWIRVFDESPACHRRRHEQRMGALVRRPLLSCLSYVSEIDGGATKQLAHDLVQQIYPRWQLVLAAPPALLPTIHAELAAAGLDPGVVTLVPAAGDFASTLNALVAAATGEFVIRIPAGATLPPHALLELALVLDRYPDAELVYSDEDAIDLDGRRSEPRFKPAWSPHYLVAVDYIGDLTMLRRRTLQQVGCWRTGLDDISDHDMKLRVTEQLPAGKIIHLAKVLVHLRRDRERGPSAAASMQLLRGLIERRRCRALIKATQRVARLRYLAAEPPRLVSLIIPTRDRADLLELCVRSILDRTAYKPFEVIIVDNDSRDRATHRLFESWRHEPRVRVLRSPGEFNFSALNNLAVREARGDLLALINNDIEVIEGHWLDEMVGLAERPEVGCVGAKLLYPDGRIQHAGVTIGLFGIAGHGHSLRPHDDPGYLDQLLYTHEVSAVTAACLVVRKSVFVEVGGFDDKELKIACNDVDFCLKVRCAGYLNVWTPFAEALHRESASRGFDYSPPKAKRSTFEASVIRRRWGPKLFSDPYYSPNLTYDRADFSVRVR